MMGNSMGAIKGACIRLNITLDDYMALVSMSKKRCTACKQWLDISLFGADRSRGDGHNFRCKKCHRESCRAYREKAKRKEGE